MNFTCPTGQIAAKGNVVPCEISNMDRLGALGFSQQHDKRTHKSPRYFILKLLKKIHLNANNGVLLS